MLQSDMASAACFHIAIRSFTDFRFASCRVPAARTYGYTMHEPHGTCCMYRRVHGACTAQKAPEKRNNVAMRVEHYYCTTSEED